ncbi:rotamase-domain-containing protein, partial [Infundibulicybe gibba]
WRVQMSSSRGLPYFYSPTLGISSWDVPSELSAEDVQKLPGAMFLKGMDQPKIHHLSGTQSLEEQARVSHILFKHTQSRNPNKKRNTEQRTRSEVLSIAQKYIKELNGSSAAFAKLAKEISDCSSYARGGDMGWFTYGQLQNDFEKEAFKLKIGEISAAPIETASGVHLILKTG